MTGLSPDIYLLAEHFPKSVNSIQLPTTNASDWLPAGTKGHGTF